MTRPATVGAARRETARRLARAGIDGAGLDARLLVGSVLDGGAAAVLGHPERDLSPEQGRKLADRVGRRERRQPLARILGRREFWRHSFRVGNDTLIPRPESETLIEAALDRFPRRDAPLSILDLGTGGGCLLLSLLGELPGASGVGIDISPAALAVAAANADDLGLARRTRLAAGDWGRAVGGRFDLIVANPPYVASGELGGLMPEVADHEPRIALDGGADGLACHRAIARQLAGLAAAGGIVVLEVGAGQASRVAALVRRHRLRVVEIRDDLAGIERCIVATPGGQ